MQRLALDEPAETYGKLTVSREAILEFEVHAHGNLACIGQCLLVDGGMIRGT